MTFVVDLLSFIDNFVQFPIDKNTFASVVFSKFEF